MDRRLTLRERYRWVLGLLSRRSCVNANGKPKQRFDTAAKARKAADSMARRSGREFDVYRCIFWCRKYHFGGTVRRTGS